MPITSRFISNHISTNMLSDYVNHYQDLGAERWWLSMRELGVPVIKRVSEKECDVLFLWRDPQGDDAISSINGSKALIFGFGR